MPNILNSFQFRPALCHALLFFVVGDDREEVTLCAKFIGLVDISTNESFLWEVENKVKNFEYTVYVDCHMARVRVHTVRPL